MGLIVIALVGLAYYLGQNHSPRATAIKEESEKTRYEPKPYLPSKCELDAEETIEIELENKDRRYELGQGKSYEIEGDGGRIEMPAFNREYGILSVMERHAMRGEEHTRDLDDHGIDVHCRYCYAN